VKNQSKKAQLFHFDLFGKREEKYDFLYNESIGSVRWQELDCPEPYHFFVPKDFNESILYDKWIPLNQLFPIYNSGVKTDRDPLFIGFDHAVIVKRFQTLLSKSFDKAFVEKFRIVDSGSYKITSKIINTNFSEIFITPIQYRVLDWRFTYYDTKIVSRSAQKAMRHVFQKDNLGLIFKRQSKEESCGYSNFFISKTLIIDGLFAIDPLGREVLAPLYLYKEESNQQTFKDSPSRQPNLNLQIVGQIAENLRLKFTSEKIDEAGTFAPIDILDYIYGVLHSPSYREKYKEFLKIDFPRVPYPKDPETFWNLVALGSQLRQIHLLESPVVEKFITTYPEPGSNLVDKVRFEAGKVRINDQQYFAGVPEISWSFYIGGYQPAQKWLKDRKGRVLTFEDILHYQKIIVALSETDRLMKEIDKIGFE